ncbi:MAG: hypothetical protein RL442_2901, partial [Pseudomonadota bacterium]
MATAIANPSMTAGGADKAPGGAVSAGNTPTAVKASDLVKSPSSQLLSDPMGFVRDLVRQPTVKKMLPIIIILMVVAAFALASLSMKTPSYRPLSMML